MCAVFRATRGKLHTINWEVPLCRRLKAAAHRPHNAICVGCANKESLMKILIDSAALPEIQQALGTGFVAGVTTNPTLLRRAGVRAAALPDLVRQALAAGAPEMHLQVSAADLAGMLADAEQLVALAPAQAVVKIPATPDGYRAAARLAAAGTRVTLTAVYTLRQALLAGSVGARYVAIYLGRMRDAGLDALALAREMQALLEAQRSDVTILAASIRDPDEIVALGQAGVGAATLPAAIIGRLLESEATAHAAERFGADARALLDE
jgi:transaldolase